MPADTDTLRSLAVLRELPAAPKIWADLVAIDDAEPDAPDRCAAVITRDPVLAAGLVELVRGTSFLAVTEDEVRRVITSRGTESTRCLALALLFRTTMLRWGRPGSPLDRALWWQHSVGTAVAASRLARLMPVPALSCWAAGLLHDAGILAVDRLAPQLLWSGECLEGTEAEDDPGRILDVSHCTLGGMLAERWRLPLRCPSAVLRHHEPAKAHPGERTLASIVCVADVVMSPDWGWWYDGGPEEEYRNALDHLGLDEYAIRNLREESEAEIRGWQPLLRWPVAH